ncbi:MAG: hypothetical protein M0T72_02240 [Candidatus Dormibacteraeota bacterium]|nr:hypothetical protein [Candidatus Dormibacteraeota bacterium]
MAEPIEFRADPGRRRLIRSVFEPSSLEEVVAAVAIAAAEGCGSIYVERSKGRYRWSPSHRGGPYPLLRVVARLLQVDYQLAFIGFRTVADGWCIWVEDPNDRVEPDAYAVLDGEQLRTTRSLGAVIEAALEAGVNEWPLPTAPRPSPPPQRPPVLPSDPAVRSRVLETILSSLLENPSERPWVCFRSRADSGQYVQLMRHDAVVYAEVGSGMWEGPLCPLGVSAVRRLRWLGFVGGGERHNFARDKLPRDATWLARLLQCLFRVAYGVSDLTGAVVDASDDVIRAALLEAGD